MTENITQTPVNMQIPPPSVTGIKVPNNLNVGNPSAYEKIKARHQEAVDAISIKNKKHTTPNKHKFSSFISFAAGLTVGVLGFVGIKRLIKK